MTLAKKAIKHGSWFALFKLISQFISWGVTIGVARILSPTDYALSAVATMITGYAELLSEMGIGASIIQKQEPTERDLSSIFWFSLGIGLLFAAACFPVAYLTAYIFDEPKVIPLVMSISVLFVFTGLQVVPLSLLKRDLNYKAVGLIEMQTTIVSCLCMLVIAYFDGGVWTLIGGRIIRGVVRLALVYRTTTWRPKLYYNFTEAKGYLQFGIMVAASSSVFYLFEVSDRFFAGRAWELEALGYYLFAMQLAQMPMNKFVSTINQVTYALFSRYQDNREKFTEYYLATIKFTAILVFPVFVLGFLLGEDLVPILLGEKWLPMTVLFEYLCLAQILITLNAVVNFVHMALGKPKRGLYFSSVCALLMSISYYFAVQYHKEAILIPWFTTYLLITVVWVGYTNRELGIGVLKYASALWSPTVGVLVISAVVYAVKNIGQFYVISPEIMLLISVSVSAISYIFFLWFFDRNILTFIKSFKA